MSELIHLRQSLAPFAAFNGYSADAGAFLQSQIAVAFPGISTALAETRMQPMPSVSIASAMTADGRVTQFGEMLVPAQDDGIAQALLALKHATALQVPESANGVLIAQLERPGSVLALPLHGGDEGQRFLLLAHPDVSFFDSVDKHGLWTEAALVAAVLDERVASRRLVRAANREADELIDLAEVQQLLQPFSPIIRGLEYAFHWQPASGAAGDYYDVMPLTWMAGPKYLPEYGDWWGVMIGDVSGHGPAAAMEAVQFDAILRTYKGDEPPGGPAGALTYANRYFFSRRQRRCFLTSFAALFRAEHGELDYVCAGHPSALLKRGNEVRLLGEGDDGDIPLGIVRDHNWRNRTIKFGEGDLLVLYTDGVIEAKNAQDEQFGAERLKRYVENGPDDANAMLSRLRLKLIAHQGGEIGVDDQTIVVLQQRGARSAA